MNSRHRREPLLAIAAVLCGGWGFAAVCRAADQPLPLGVVRATVGQALRDAADARDFQARDRAVRRLVDLRRRLEADPRVESSVALRGLIHRVDRGLVQAGRDLAGPASKSEAVPSRSAYGGGQAGAAALVDLIRATVRPEAWDVNGGSGSIIYFANGHGLVVLAPDDVHDEVGDLLRRLR